MTPCSSFFAHISFQVWLISKPHRDFYLFFELQKWKKKLFFLTFLPKNIICSLYLCESNKKNRFMIYLLSQEISQWVNPRGTSCIQSILLGIYWFQIMNTRHVHVYIKWTIREGHSFFSNRTWTWTTFIFLMNLNGFFLTKQTNLNKRKT